MLIKHWFEYLTIWINGSSKIFFWGEKGGGGGGDGSPFVYWTITNNLLEATSK